MIRSATDLAGREAPALVPARMLNEFCYCPRLGYLEWVEGEFADNLETLEGSFGHRRVDRDQRTPVDAPAGDAPTAGTSTAETPGVGVPPTDAPAPDPTPDELAFDKCKTLHARSLLLSAPGEGLIAKMDLVEVDGPEATPIDYKRGKAPDLPEGAYEPERVQLCAQGLILREAGFRSDRGVLYFIASKKRVTIEFDDNLVSRTRQLVADFRRSAVGPIPPPLVDSPKCPRCSLVGICLPDETTLLRAEVADRDADAGRIRRLIPAADDALPLYVQEQGAFVGKAGDRLQVRKNGETLAETKLIHASQVCLFGNAQISSQLVRELVERGIAVCHFTYGGWLAAMTTGLTHNNIALRIEQFAVAADAGRSLPIAKSLIEGKIRNGRTLLRRNQTGDSADLDSLADLSRRVNEVAAAESLLGVEGMAAKTYFAGLATTLKPGLGFSIDGRNRRPPTDPVNALLSFAYALLIKDCTVVLQAVGFDPMLGFYHRPRFGRPSLALDFAEPFRPLIADSVALTLINTGEVRPGDFVSRAGAVAMTNTARKALLGAYERRMQTEITHPIFGYRISYRRLLEVQARLLARVVTREIADFPVFQTR